MTGSKVLLAVLFLTMVVSSKQAQEKKKKSPCTCVPLSFCSHYIKVFEEENWKAFKEGICGYEDNEYQMCCPRDKLPKKCGLPKYTEDNRIIGGKPAEYGQFPWMALISFMSDDGEVFACGGSLINKRYVLSAAHCFDHNIPIHKVRIGELDHSIDPDCTNDTLDGEICHPPVQEYSVDEVIPHPNFNNSNMYADIALIRLEIPVKNARHSTICLPEQGMNIKKLVDYTGKMMVVAGWGLVQMSQEEGKITSETTTQLQYVDIQMRDHQACRDVFKNRYAEKMICAGGEKDKDSCKGDSGGPLFIEGPNGPPFLQLGIVSHGYGCGVENSPAVYTSVTEYRNWIDRNIFI